MSYFLVCACSQDHLMRSPWVLTLFQHLYIQHGLLSFLAFLFPPIPPCLLVFDTPPTTLSPATMFQTISFVLLAFASFVAAQSRHGLQPPADPFADPKHDVFNPLRYIASDALSGMGVGEFPVQIVTRAVNWKWGRISVPIRFQENTPSTHFA